MYQIIYDGSESYVDNVVYIKLHAENGCYVICGEADAEGVCVKIPKVITGEFGTITTCEDTVFALREGGLHGTEAVCEIYPAEIALDYFKAKHSAEIVAMLEEVL